MDREQFDEYYASLKTTKVKISPGTIPVITTLPQFDSLEPSSFDEYIGQEKAKEMVGILAEAAGKENRLIPNILLTGSAGLGKTTLGKILLKDEPCVFIDGNAFNNSYLSISGYAIIDEIHNVKPEICDSLNVMLDNKKMNVIGCTTNPGALPAALRSRFRIVQLFPYSTENLVDIMKGVLSRKKKFKVDDELLIHVAQRGRSTPRRVLQYLSFILDVMIVKKEKELSASTLFEAFDKIGVDEWGLLEVDHRYLATFPSDGRSVGLQYLSARLGVDRETIEEEIEPYLMELGLIDRTAKGRKRL